jgi:hypothetical protein
MCTTTVHATLRIRAVESKRLVPELDEAVPSASGDLALHITRESVLEENWMMYKIAKKDFVQTRDLQRDHSVVPVRFRSE